MRQGLARRQTDIVEALEEVDRRARNRLEWGGNWVGHAEHVYELDNKPWRRRELHIMNAGLTPSLQRRECKSANEDSIQRAVENT